MTVPAMIDTEVLGVPMPTRPMLWDRDLPVERNVSRLRRWMAAYADRMPSQFTAFDEAAIMVPSPWHVEDLGKDLRGAGWEWFNAASDLVYTNPFGTRYFVEYNFFRMEHVPFRLEVMNMSEGRMDGETGFSPLHAALWPNGMVPNSAGVRRFPVPHLSFKPYAYPDASLQRQYSLAVDDLKAKAFIHAQTCQSTYGGFSYWLPNDASVQLYVKPRINVRDAA